MSTEEKPATIIEQVKETVTVVTEKITEIKETIIDEEIISEYKLLGSDAAEKILSQLNESAALISQSGFIMKNISIGMGIPPSIGITFNYSNEISDSEKESLLTQSEDKKILTLILKALFKATDMYKKVKIGNYKLDNVKIAIGIIPDISINLVTE
ncbi:MAG TPA: hypothetical protein PK536_09095 [Ignavibacteria bacterium]|nr:hypothetical protein [Bacteroidota bacterium]HRI85589.1 hypothetical protein [Ignavibacteria bacterium]HRJ98797.1 hypothetical protein [Ignavibacteria bacterium]